MRFSILFFLSESLFSATCKKDVILGVFPKIDGMNCNNYALMISFVAIVGAYLFWSNVTK